MYLKLEKLKTNLDELCHSPLFACIKGLTGISIIVTIFFGFIGMGLLTEITLHHDTIDIHTGCEYNITKCTEKSLCNLSVPFNIYHGCYILGALTVLITITSLTIIYFTVSGVNYILLEYNI